MSLLPQLFYPRCTASLNIVLDDQIDESPGVPVAYDFTPKRVDITRNDARTADTCELTLDYRDFPFDPRCIRQAHVAVYVENVIDPTIPLVGTPLNLRFIGMLDDVKTSRSKDDETVEFKCRDYTGMALDTRFSAIWPPIAVRAIAPALPLADLFPLTSLADCVARIKAQMWPLVARPPLFLDLAAQHVVLATRASKLNWTWKKDASVWDVLNDLCSMAGQVPCWNRDQLEIRPPAFPRPNPTQFVYGANLESLTFERDYKGAKSKPVRVVSWDPKTGISSEGQYPSVADAAAARKTQKAGTAGKPGAAGAATPTPTVVEVVQYNVQGTWTIPDLIVIAAQLYMEASSHEVTGSLETYDLTDLTGKIDLLGLANGDSVGVQINPVLDAQIEGMTDPEAVVFLSDPTKPGFMLPDVASAFIQMRAQARALKSQFYVKASHITFDNDEPSCSLKVDFITYILPVG